jgi:hypothetical protein
VQLYASAPATICPDGFLGANKGMSDNQPFMLEAKAMELAAALTRATKFSPRVRYAEKVQNRA